MENRWRIVEDIRRIEWMLPSLTREFIITFVCSRNSCSLQSIWIFRINNFRGRFISTGRIPGIFFLSLWKISRNLDFHKFLWKINGRIASLQVFHRAHVGEKLANLRLGRVKISCLRNISIGYIPLIFEIVSLSRNYLLIKTYLSLVLCFPPTIIPFRSENFLLSNTGMISSSLLS